MSSRIPLLLELYLSLPPETCFILLTNVLGASTNWLVLRYLHSFLLPPAKNTEDGRGIGEGRNVVLVSFLRDWAFWREGARKLGLDLDKHMHKNRFAFTDGLTSLFLPQTSSKASLSATLSPAILRTTELAQIHKDILSSIKSLRDTDSGAAHEKPILIIDGLDFLLAASAHADPTSLCTTVLELREHVHSTILCLACDEPLVHRQHTPLEINQASFLLSMAHMADLVVSLRGLDTGSARDVSGVLRISRMRDISEYGEVDGEEEEGRELLYYVGGDGNVKVFERGQ